MAYSMGCEFYGKDHKHIKNMTKDACKKLCFKKKSCIYFNWRQNRGLCQMKNGEVKLEMSNNDISKNETITMCGFKCKEFIFAKKDKQSESLLIF
jgi:hypothetical protein